MTIPAVIILTQGQVHSATPPEAITPVARYIATKTLERAVREYRSYCMRARNHNAAHPQHAWKIVGAKHWLANNWHPYWRFAGWYFAWTLPVAFGARLLEQTNLALDELIAEVYHWDRGIVTSMVPHYARSTMDAPFNQRIWQRREIT